MGWRWTNGHVFSTTSRFFPPWNLTSVPTIPQFNLESPKSTLFEDELRRFRSITSSVPTVDQFELQVVLRVPKPQGRFALVYSLPESPNSYVEVADPPDAIHLESWMISFSDYGDEGNQGHELSGAYKQGISIFRVAYTLLRRLPAWKLRNDLQRRMSSGDGVEGFGIELRARFHPAQWADAGCEGESHF